MKKLILTAAAFLLTNCTHTDNAVLAGVATGMVNGAGIRI
jgi:hypothetical protein